MIDPVSGTDAGEERGRGVRVIPLGGIGEIGKNMTVVEGPEGSVLIDAGLSFPRDEMLGVDLVLPDLAYLRATADRLRAVILTHGHEDHVGALPYVVREIGVPEVWATRLTLGLVKSKLDEHGLIKATELREIEPARGPVRVGPFEAEFVRVTHSVPDAVAVVLHTPEGTILHTGDIKIDHTPIDGVRTDLGRLAAIGAAGVALMLGDSTNAERPGVTPSEAVVARELRRIVGEASGRVIVTSFASHIHRLQEVVDAAVAAGRQVCVVGRSMVKNLNIARNLGYASVPEGVLVKPAELEELAPDRVVILCTGSRGEPLSALTRIAFGDHPTVRIVPGDTVVLSAKPVPGNELAVHDTMNQLWRAGARVLHQEVAPVHVSGHGSADELKTVLALVRPDHFMPVHGEVRHLVAHAELATSMGVPEARVFVTDNGTVLELEAGVVRRAGRVEAGVTFVDGLGIGDVQDVVLRDRRQLSADGVLIVVCQLSSNGAGPVPPEVIARGFAPEGAEAESLLDDVRERAAAVVLESDVREAKLVGAHLHDALAELIHRRSRKRPLILPIVVEL
jgi:ribonuclease J